MGLIVLMQVHYGTYSLDADFIMRLIVLMLVQYDSFSLEGDSVWDISLDAGSVRDL